MLLTLTTTHRPATDLGYLLHKNPNRPQVAELPFGHVHVFYPEASEDRCTAAIMLDIDPIALVRNRRGPPGEGFVLSQYVNDRPYVASSFLSVAIAQVLGTALGGRSRERAELAQTPLPLTARISVLPSRGGEALLRRLFEPLGYSVDAVRLPLDEQFPEWGEGPYFSVTLAGVVTLQQMLRHLYVLVPVLDNDKHYWVGDDEVDKLVRHGEEWLSGHPEKEQIVNRYLKHRKHLARQALSQLLEEDQSEVDDVAQERATEEERVESKISLNEQRLNAVLAAIKSSGATRVLDLGCGTGKLFRLLMEDKQFDQVVGMDVSYRSLEGAAIKLNLDRLPERQKQRLQLIQGSLTYRDKRLAGFDAAAVVEVIEHQDPARLWAFERALFEAARPGVVVVTTPNVEYNVRFESLPAGRFRHRDHRFEWTRSQFRDWAASTAKRFSYEVRFLSIGPEDPEVGPPTQMAIFNRGGPADAIGRP